MEAKQLDLFSWPKEVSAKPKKPKVQVEKVPVKPKKISLKLRSGEVAYQCLECDEEPTIYDRIVPKATCPKCNVLLEVIDEKIQKIN